MTPAQLDAAVADYRQAHHERLCAMIDGQFARADRARENGTRGHFVAAERHMLTALVSTPLGHMVIDADERRAA